MIVRDAVLTDAERIGRIHVDTWRAAYHGLVPQEHLDGLDPEDSARGWASRLPAVRPRHVLVAEDAGRVVGFAGGGPARDEDDAGPGADVAPAPGEVYALYVSPHAWGTGAGRDLLRTLEDRLARDGCGTAVLWVLAGNDRARRFYERQGWAADGAAKHDRTRGFALLEVRYAKDLARAR